MQENKIQSGLVYTRKELAEHLKVNVRTVDKLLKSDKIKSFKVGKSLRIRGEEILNYKED